MFKPHTFPKCRQSHVLRSRGSALWPGKIIQSSTCAYPYIHLHIYIYMPIYLYMYTYIYIYISLSLSLSLFVLSLSLSCLQTFRSSISRQYQCPRTAYRLFVSMLVVRTAGTKHRSCYVLAKPLQHMSWRVLGCNFVMVPNTKTRLLHRCRCCSPSADVFFCVPSNRTFRTCRLKYDHRTFSPIPNALLFMSLNQVSLFRAPRYDFRSIAHLPGSE